MPKHALSTRQHTALAALLACAVLLPLLGHRPLTDWDEGIYAEIAREMLATHQFLTPHWNGHLWFEKPPLQMWLTAASLRLFGLNAFAARLPSALAGIATVTVLHAWLQRRKDGLTAWLSTLFLLSAFGFQHVARVGETDTLLTLFSLIATLGLAEVLCRNALGWLLFWAGFALALMTKGAGSFTLPLTALLLTALHPRTLFQHARTFTAGLLLLVALTLPWHAYTYTHFGQAFLHDYLGFHTFTRATSAIEGHQTHPWFYLWVLLVSAPPFALLYPVAAIAPFRTRNSKRNGTGQIPLPFETQHQTAHTATKPASTNPHSRSQALPDSPVATPDLDPLQAVAVFALITFILFSAAGTRLPHYVAPTYPAFSGLTAALIATWLQRRSPSPLKLTLALGSAGILLYAATALLTAKARSSLHNPQLLPGFNTPDNRESVALLQQLRRSPAAALPSGPLLVWRQTPVVPLTTDAFYARRLALQVSLTPSPANLPSDPYFNQPQPLTSLTQVPHLLLLDRTLLPRLPPGVNLTPLATGNTQELAIVTPRTP